MVTIQKVYELNDDEIAWRDALFAVLEDDLYIRGDLEALDEFFAGAREQWYATAPDERVDPNPTVCVVGAGAGEILAQRLGLSWGMIQAGGSSTAMGLHGEPGGIIVLPLESLGKMWVDGGSVAQFVNQVTEQVFEVRRSLG